MSSFFYRPLILLGLLLSVHVSTAFAQVTRIEQNDPSIVYSGNWYSNSSEQHSGGVAALTNARGARATITFNGTGITWVGVIDGWAGLATVYLDGTMKVIDSYGSSMQYQAPLFVMRGLSAGPHTLSIEVTHERGVNTDGSWVWIDAFHIENGGAVPGGVAAGTGRVEESNPALIYFGRWFSNSNPEHSGGSATLATDPGSRVDVHFTGTGISWIAYRDEWSGIARVYIDGQLQSTTDDYQSPTQTRTVLYNVGGLPRGSHTLEIEVTGTRNSSSKGSWIWVDAFDIAP
jgi:alpha-amylase